MTADAEKRRPSAPAHRVHRLMFIGFLLGAAGWIAAGLGVPFSADSRWPQLAFLLLGLATTLFGLAQTLPLQNVIASTTVIAVIAAAAQILNVNFSIPFSPRIYTDDLGPRWLGVPWPVPVIWVVAILNSRGVARLILRPWRKLGRYGYWTIGLAGLLAVIFDLSLEPFATAANSFWVWGTPLAGAWPAAPWVNFLGWAVTALLILAFTTPWLINKKPTRQAPPDYHPLIVWLLLNLLPAADCAAHHLWFPAGFSVLAASVVTFFAIRGARW